MKSIQVKCKIWKREQAKTLWQYNFNCLFSVSLLIYRKSFTDDYYPSSYFPRIAGREINFFIQEPAGDQWEKFCRQIINFGCQLTVFYIYLTYEH